MSRKKKERVELRYYELPRGESILPLVGDSWKRNYGNSVNCMHFHNLWEVGYCHEGNGQLELVDGRSFPYREGTFTLIPVNMAHNTRTDTPERLDYWEFLFFDMEQLISGFFAENPVTAQRLLQQLSAQPLALHREQYPHLAGLLRLMLAVQGQGGALQQPLMQCYAGAMALEWVRVTRLPGDGSLGASQHLGQIKPALDYMTQCYAQPLRVGQLAQRCGMSETHFRRLFEERVGAAPATYLNQLRIRRACQLLAGTDRTVEAIAREVGFLSQSTFNRNFSKLVGTSPYKWKRTADPARVSSLSYSIAPREGWF